MAPKRKALSPLNDPPPIESEEDQEPSHEQQQDDDDDDDDDDDNEEEEVVETDSSDDREDDEEGHDEQEKYRLSRAIQPAPKVPSSSKPNSSSSDSDSGTESDSEHEAAAPTPTPNSKVKPLASKPKEQAQKVKQVQASSSAATKVKSGSKRPAENNARSPDSKQVKKKKVPEDAPASEDKEGAKKSSHDESKKIFQRLFNDEDEIVILQGMIEFRSVTGDDPIRCFEAFNEFMTKRSKRLSFDASFGQLKEKIRRIKTKFMRNASKGDNGEAPRFSKPHDQKVFELSQVVWGESAAEGGGVVSNGALEKAKHDNGKAGKKTSNLKKENTTENVEKPKGNPEAAKAKSELQIPLVENPKKIEKIGEICDQSRGLSSLIKYDKGLGGYGLGEDLLRKGDELIEASKKAEFDAEWTKLEADEMELRVKRAELYADHAKSMAEAITSSRKLP